MALDGSRNYYDKDFAGRIRDIAKPSTPPPSPSSGSSGGSFGARSVAGVLIVVFLVGLRVLLIATRPSSSYSPPTYHYNPVTVPATPTGFERKHSGIDWRNDREPLRFEKTDFDKK